MIISSSSVSMASQRSYARNVHQTTKTTKWQLANPSNAISTTQDYSYSYKEETMYNNYNDFAQRMKDVKQNSSNNYNPETPQIVRMNRPEAYKYFQETVSETLRSLLDMLYKAKGLTRDSLADYDYYNQNFTSITDNSGTLSLNSDYYNIWNQVTDTHYSYSESETTTFESTGKAITADGREISFNVSFTMSRSFKEEYQSSAFTQYNQVLTDPLVINLSSSPISISDQTFFFDIDSDGKDDEISSLGAGCGFLAYDKNNDGVINNGSELFGTKTGNGFYDLSQYDDDGNGWIDEADNIFKKLKVWTKDENGNDRLISLKEADIGAIYLGSNETPFSITDKNNTVNAVVRSSGIFLRESGGSGSISQIDLAKHPEV